MSRSPLLRSRLVAALAKRTLLASSSAFRRSSTVLSGPRLSISALVYHRRRPPVTRPHRCTPAVRGGPRRRDPGRKSCERFSARIPYGLFPHPLNFRYRSHPVRMGQIPSAPPPHSERGGCVGAVWVACHGAGRQGGDHSRSSGERRTNDGYGDGLDVGPPEARGGGAGGRLRPRTQAGVLSPVGGRGTRRRAGRAQDTPFAGCRRSGPHLSCVRGREIGGL